MNELDIFYKIYFLYKNIKDNIRILKLISVICITVSFLFILFVLMSNLQFGYEVLYPMILIPFGVVYYYVTIREFLIFSKKFPITHWIKNEIFIQKLEQKILNSKQYDINHLRIANKGLDYITNSVNNYHGDKRKLSSTLYNKMNNTNLLKDIKFYEKTIKFKMDMEKYRIVI